MKLRSRLLITFTTMVMLPLVLTAVAFLSIELYLSHTLEAEYGFQSVDRETISQSIISNDEHTNLLFQEFFQIAQDTPEKLEDKIFLDSLNEQAKEKASYLIVRKEHALYYTGNPDAASRIFDKLPDYGFATSLLETGYYYNQLHKLVKQIDFQFRDGSEGSLFILGRNRV